MDSNEFVNVFNNNKTVISKVQTDKAEVTGEINEILGNLNAGKTGLGDVMKFIRIYGISGVMRDTIYLIVKEGATGDAVKKVKCNGIKITYNGDTIVSFEIFQNKNITQLDLQDYNKAMVVWDINGKNQEEDDFKEAMQQIADEVTDAFSSTVNLKVNMELADLPETVQ